MQAIRTRYLGPTNFRGSRIKATCDAGSITVPFDAALGVEDNHRAAMNVLLVKLGHTWYGEWVTGWLGDVAVHVRSSTVWS